MLITLNEQGYLPPGKHEMGIEEFDELFVKGFPESNTRKEIFQGYNNFCATLLSAGVSSFSQWVDGSFCSSKENPNDIDVITFIEVDVLNNLPPESRELLLALASPALRSRIKATFNCDSFILLVPLQSSPTYANFTNKRMSWRGVWGFDRNDKPKGWVKIDVGGGVQS